MISTTTSVVSYTATASQTVFAYGFRIQNQSDLLVFAEDTLGVRTNITAGIVSVSGVDNEAGGNVTLPAQSLNTIIYLVRASTFTQLWDASALNFFDPATVERVVDKLTILMQEVKTDVGACLRLDNSEQFSPLDKAARKGKIIGFNVSTGAAELLDSQATITAAATATTQAGIATTRAAAAAASASASSASAATASAQASTATTQATNSSGSASSASVSASTATTQAGIATTGGSTATTQAGIATTQAGNASTSASTATTQAGIATTQANNAAASATTATTQAGIATTQAGIATTQSSNAAASAVTAVNAISQAYKGGVAGNAVPATSALTGDTYRITSAGSSQGKSWLIGDAAIYEGTSGNWTQLTGFYSAADQFVGMKNRIINGKMDISQRGTSFVGVAGNVYTIDRWRTNNLITSGAMTVTQNSDIPPNLEFQNSLRVTVTTQDTAIANTDCCTILQQVEGYNIRDLIGRTFTLSFWVRSSKTGAHHVAIAGGLSYISAYTISMANTWEFKTITVAGGLPTAGTWNYTNGAGLNIIFVLMAGTNFHTTTVDSWIAGDFRCTSNQVNCLDTIGNIFAITGVQLEAGSAATPFEHRLYGMELALCQRYYYDPFAGNSAANLAVGMGCGTGSTTSAYAIIELPVVMRSTPTLGSVTASNFAIGYPDNYAFSTLAVSPQATNKSLVLTGTIATLLTGTTYGRFYRPGTTASIPLSAEF